MNTNTVDTAIFDRSLPCNPRPFINGLKDKMSQSMEWDDEAKRILWVLMAQAYGCLGSVNLGDEWDRLYKSYKDRVRLASE